MVDPPAAAETMSYPLMNKIKQAVVAWIICQRVEDNALHLSVPTPPLGNKPAANF